MFDDSKIMERVEQVIRKRHYSYKTEAAYSNWIYLFIAFNKQRHPNRMGKTEVEKFLHFLAFEKRVSESTQNQAINAITFFFKNILHVSINDIDSYYTYSRKKMPLVLKRDEIKKILNQLNGEKKLMASLLYGSGLRLMECVNLRIGDIDFKQNEVIVRNFAEGKNRKTILPHNLESACKRQVEKAKIMFEENCMIQSFSGASMPEPFKKSYQKFQKKPDWQFIFPSDKLTTKIYSGKLVQHHKHESYLQKAIKSVVQNLEFNKSISCNTFRHSFATHLLEDGYDVHVVQELLGHKDVRSTMKYNHVLNRSKLNVHSPLDIF
jgi:integron integrase